MDDELDMEDIESRLYSQVYHASVENEHNSNENIEPATRVSLQSTPYTLSNVPTRSNRYFHKEHVNHPIQSSYISFDDLTALQNNISFSPNSTDITTEGNFGSQFQNNITVNQYTLPVIINPEFSEVLNPSFGGKFFTSWAVKNQRLLSKKKQSKRVEIRKERKRQKKLENRVNNLLIEMHGSGDAQRKVNDVIYVSDDSDECIIQDKDVTSSVESQNVFTGFPKKYNENDETSKKPESDDDIIYIPPPPVEIVTLDSDEKELETVESLQISPNYARELSPNNAKCIQEELSIPESSTTNDFLDNLSIDNNISKFNFSLHGSDFNISQGEFVRPANPVDFCETESSCSTNDLNRDFNNSVKTVVFDEVEFPREDIFAENNLEKFGTYITPRRNTNKKSGDLTIAANSDNIKTKTVDIHSSDSSSESDYECPEYVNRGLKIDRSQSNKKLPVLSPMLPEKIVSEVTTPKMSLVKRKDSLEFFKDESSPKKVPASKKDLSKRKFDIIDVSETDSDTCRGAAKSASKKQPKKKMSKSFESINICAKKNTKNRMSDTSFDSSKAVVINSDVQKKKKKKQAEQTTEKEKNIDNLEHPQNKKKKSSSEVNNSESGENTVEDTITPKKKRKKKPLDYNLYKIENNILANVLAGKLSEENVVKATDSKKMHSKGKKDSLKSNNSENEGNTDANTSATQKKKRKTSLDSKNLENDNNIVTNVLVEQTEENIRQDMPENPRSKKKKGSSESNNSDASIGHIIKKRNKRNSSGSKCLENDIATFDFEVKIKKKNDRPIESTQFPTPDNANEENFTEKPRKKKKKNVSSDNSETDDTTRDKQQMVGKISFSELSDQQPLEERIETEVQKKKKKKTLLPPDTEPDTSVLETAHMDSICSSNELKIEVALNIQEKEITTAEKKQQPFNENILDNKFQNVPVPVNVINEVEICATEGLGENESDEEIIVVDEIDLNSSDFIVVDDLESTVINANNDLEIVLSSDSEYDFKELNSVGKDLKLANCSVQPEVQPDVSDSSEELIVVDDNSGSNIESRAVYENYSNFDVDVIQRTQTDDAEAWKISHKDRIIHLNVDKSKGPRCNRCRQFGHVAIKCTEKQFPPSCSLCGNPGHQEPRCPNKICTQCGNEGDYSTTYCWKCFKFRNSICKTCNMKGHIAKTCPDLWRRYHLTTDDPLTTYEETQLKPKDQKWCASCATQDHLECECYLYKKNYTSDKSLLIKREEIELQKRNQRWCSICARQDHLDYECHAQNRQELPISLQTNDNDGSWLGAEMSSVLQPQNSSLNTELSGNRHISSYQSDSSQEIQLIQRDQKWCLNCAEQGHLVYECYFYKTNHFDKRPLINSIGTELQSRDQKWCLNCERQGHLDYECYSQNRQELPSSLQTNEKDGSCFGEEMIPALRPQNSFVNTEVSGNRHIWSYQGDSPQSTQLIPRDEQWHLNCTEQGHLVYNECNLPKANYSSDESLLIKREEPVLQPRDLRWCLNCTRQGHLDYECEPQNSQDLSRSSDMQYKDGNCFGEEMIPIFRPEKIAVTTDLSGNRHIWSYQTYCPQETWAKPKQKDHSSRARQDHLEYKRHLRKICPPDEGLLINETILQPVDEKCARQGHLDNNLSNNLTSSSPTNVKDDKEMIPSLLPQNPLITFDLSGDNHVWSDQMHHSSTRITPTFSLEMSDPFESSQEANFSAAENFLSELAWDFKRLHQYRTNSSFHRGVLDKIEINTNNDFTVDDVSYNFFDSVPEVRIGHNTYVPSFSAKEKKRSKAYQQNSKWRKQAPFPPDNDQIEIKDLIMKMSYAVTKDFLDKEMGELGVVSGYNPVDLKKGLVKYDNLLLSKKPLTTQILKDKRSWNKILNMFIFGVHKFGKGMFHINYLRRYLEASKANGIKKNRKALFVSYSYIFGTEKHTNINYYKLINRLIVMHKESRINKLAL